MEFGSLTKFSESISRCDRQKEELDKATTRYRLPASGPRLNSSKRISEAAMFRVAILMSMSTFLLTTTTASAQVCPLNGTTSRKLVCLIPQVYGPFGFGFGPGQDPTTSVLYTGDHHAAHFDADFLSTFAPINQAVGIQVSQLPIASP